MDTLIRSFLPKSIHRIHLNEGSNLWIQDCSIRPFGSAFVAKGKDIRFIPDRILNAKQIIIWIQSIMVTMRHVVYTIHSTIEIREITLRIAGITMRLHGVRILFLDDPDPTRVEISVEEISFGSIFVIKRFHHETQQGVVIKIQRDSSVVIHVPEVRILSWIPISKL
jgi:hypothetical protein